MSGICGWMGGAADPQTIAPRAATLVRFDSSAARNACSGFGAVAVAGNDAEVFQEDGRLVAWCGRARFTDTELARLAQHHGIARGLAYGYAHRGADVLAR